MKFSFCKREKIEAFGLLRLVLRKLEKNVLKILPLKKTASGSTPLKFLV
jgi:hypothetical protein